MLVSKGGRGRPQKYGRPARAVTVTLPEDVLGRLSAIHADVGRAIVRLVERKAPARAVKINPAEIARFGNQAVIVVTPVKALRRLPGVELVPIGDGRALISLESSPRSIAALELQIRDAIERGDAHGDERTALEFVAAVLKQGRGRQGVSLEARSIIVLVSNKRRRPA
jgi:hypothetical protein